MNHEQSKYVSGEDTAREILNELRDEIEDVAAQLEVAGFATRQVAILLRHAVTDVAKAMREIR